MDLDAPGSQYLRVCNPILAYSHFIKILSLKFFGFIPSPRSRHPSVGGAHPSKRLRSADSVRRLPGALQNRGSQGAELSNGNLRLEVEVMIYDDLDDL